MKYTKSIVKGMRDNYREMYDVIKNWNEEAPAGPVNEHYIYVLGYALGDIGYFGFTEDETQNEIHHYQEIKRAHKALKVALQNALGIEQTKQEY